MPIQARLAEPTAYPYPRREHTHMQLPIAMATAEAIAYNAGAESVIERSDLTLQIDTSALIHANDDGWSIHRYPCNTPLRKCRTADELREALARI